MSKRSGVFDVQVDVSKFIRGEQENQPERSLMTLEKAMRVIVRQMQVSGFRERTKNFSTSAKHHKRYILLLLKV